MAGISLTRQQALVLGVALFVLLAFAGKRLASAGAAEGPRRVAPLALARGGAAAAVPPTKLVVHVAGAVRRSGLYRLREGARVADAIARAGGATRRADLDLLNLAAPLADGQQVLVPRRGPVGAGGAPAADTEAGSPPGAKVSLASATVEQLEALPGIGPVTAGQIVEWRDTRGPFRSVEDLDDVPGIGPARIEQLRDLVTP